MRKVALRALGALAASLTFGAQAADLGVAPVYKAAPVAVFSWTGFYLGGSAGTRAAVVDTSVASANVTAPGFASNLLDPAVCGTGCVNGASLDNLSFRIGPFVGFNWQFGSWVAGVEGDWAWADRTRTLNGSIYPAPAVLGPPNTGSSYAVRTTWDASARARLGFLVTPTILFYATGGASWIHAETTSTCSTAVFAPCGGFGGLLDPFAPGVTSHASTRLGWTLGGGFEAQLWGNWLARAEYRFADYGTWSSTDVRTCPPAGGLICFAGPVGSTLTVVNDVRLRTHTAAFGLAYKF